MIRKSILDDKFIHNTWFKGQHLTIRQALKLLAKSGDSYIDTKRIYDDAQANLFVEPVTQFVLRNSESPKAFYKLNDETKEYFLECQSFWKHKEQEIKKEFLRLNNLHEMDINPIIVYNSRQYLEFYNNCIQADLNP